MRRKEERSKQGQSSVELDFKIAKYHVESLYFLTPEIRDTWFPGYLSDSMIIHLDVATTSKENAVELFFFPMVTYIIHV